MKHFFTISLCFLALSLSAQTDGQCCDPDGTNYSGALNCIANGHALYLGDDGCVEDPDCSNYNPNYGCVSCGEGTIWDISSQTCVVEDPCGWQPDGNADGLIGVEDLLDLLAVYGDTDLDSDGVWDSVDDCTDGNACNYSNDPTEPCNYIDVLGVCGGDCEGDVDGDGICDSEDDCVGVNDECGVCNGDGAIYECGCSDIPEGDCDCDGNVPDQGYDCENNITEPYLGMLAYGGIVFYIDETAVHGLVVSSNNLGEFEWGCYCNSSVNTSSGIGTGAANTENIVGTCNGSAAFQCSVYESNGYSDWYLPSIDELATAMGYFYNYFDEELFWSSTGYGSCRALSYGLGIHNSQRYYTHKVRAVRSF